MINIEGKAFECLTNLAFVGERNHIQGSEIICDMESAYRGLLDLQVIDLLHVNFVKYNFNTGCNGKVVAYGSRPDDSMLRSACVHLRAVHPPTLTEFDVLFLPEPEKTVTRRREENYTGIGDVYSFGRYEGTAKAVWNDKRQFLESLVEINKRIISYECDNNGKNKKFEVVYTENIYLSEENYKFDGIVACKNISSKSLSDGEYIRSELSWGDERDTKVRFIFRVSVR